jgi:hypothetical protein
MMSIIMVKLSSKRQQSYHIYRLTVTDDIYLSSVPFWFDMPMYVCILCVKKEMELNHPLAATLEFCNCSP